MSELRQREEEFDALQLKNSVSKDGKSNKQQNSYNPNNYDIYMMSMVRSDKLK